MVNQLIRSSCKNYHPLSSLYCIARTSQSGPGTTLLTMYFFSRQYCRSEYPQEIFSTILSTTYFLSGLCVWRIFVYFLIISYDIWRGIYHKISMYFLITCWMPQVLKVLDWWAIYWLIFWSITRVDQKINWPEIMPSVRPKKLHPHHHQGGIPWQS